jgi:hypothetical protein
MKLHDLAREAMRERVLTDSNERKYITTEPLPVGDIRALKHRIHELEGELLGYKKILADQVTKEDV